MRHITRWISALSIKTKLVAGFACVLTILLAVAGIGYWRFLGVAGSLGSYVERVALVAASRDIDQSFSELRRHTREFAYTGNQDEGSAAAKASEEVRANIARGAAIAENPELHRRMQEIATQLTDCQKGIDEVFVLKRSQDRVVFETLDPTGTDARSREIAAQIATIRGATAEAVNAVREVRSSIEQVSEVASAIAAAVEEQTATTREIASNAQSVLVSAQAATQAMQDVSAVSEFTEAASGSVLHRADELGKTADVLRSELTLFLQAMAKTDEEDRRRYERIDAGGATTVLHLAGRDAMRVTILNISRGGVALRTDWSAQAGTEVRLELPGLPEPVFARVASRRDGMLALAFRQDETMLRRVDAVLEQIGRQGIARAAA